MGANMNKHVIVEEERDKDMIKCRQDVNQWMDEEWEKREMRANQAKANANFIVNY